MQKHPLILIASACLVLAACTSKEPAGRGGAGVPAIPVTTALVEPMQWVDTIEAVLTLAQQARQLAAQGRTTIAPIPPGAKIRVRAGKTTFLVSAVPQPRRHAARPHARCCAGRGPPGRPRRRR